MNIKIITAAILAITFPFAAFTGDFVSSKTGTYSDCVETSSGASGNINNASRTGKTQAGTQGPIGKRATIKCAPKPTPKPTNYHPQDHIKIPVNRGNNVTTSTTIINSTPAGNQVIVNQTTVPIVTAPTPATAIPAVTDK